jgi:phospholipid/cholesterol/gamma-HCH transport system ATP-binding protein
LARAIALDPDILFFDEPSADRPDASRRLDTSSICAAASRTIVVVTHELASIFAIGDNSVLLDGQSRR